MCDGEAERRCFRCNNIGHMASDRSCPARGSTCTKCGGKNHWAAACRAKEKTAKKTRAIDSNKTVLNDCGVNGDECNPQYAFKLKQARNDDDTPYVDIRLGNVSTKIICDSGCTQTCVGRNTWEELKRNPKFKCISHSKSAKIDLFPYGCDIALLILGKFKAIVHHWLR